jgi:hypothetical protein
VTGFAFTKTGVYTVTNADLVGALITFMLDQELSS